MVENAERTVFDLITILREDKRNRLEKGMVVEKIANILALPILHKEENYSKSAEWLYDEIVQMNKVLREQRAAAARSFCVFHKDNDESEPLYIADKKEIERLTALQYTLNCFILFLKNNDYFSVN